MIYYKRSELLKPFMAAIRQHEPALLCVLGDSNSCNAHFTSGGKQWVELLHSELRSQCDSQSILVLNSGISGNTIIDGLKRFHTDVGRFQPDCCIIAMGSNDANKITNDEFRDGMRRCIDRLLALGTKVVIRTTQPICEFEPTPSHIWLDDDKLKEKNQINEELAEEYQLAFIDVYKQWCDWEKEGTIVLGEMMYDAVHYNTLGHQHIYRSIAPLFSLTPNFAWERESKD